MLESQATKYKRIELNRLERQIARELTEPGYKDPTVPWPEDKALRKSAFATPAHPQLGGHPVLGAD